MASKASPPTSSFGYNMEDMKTNREESSYLGKSFARLLLGAVSGFLTAVPFFNNRAFSETFHMEDSEKKRWFSGKWSYFLGAFLGFFFFFLVPVRYLAEGYPLAILCMFLGLSLVFGVYEIYCLYRKKKRQHIPSSIVLFILFFALPIMLHFYPISLLQTEGHAFFLMLALLLLLGTFFAAFSGISIGSILYLSGSYLTFSDSMAEIARFKDVSDRNLFIVVVFLAVLVGGLLAQCLRRFSLTMEKDAINGGLHLGVIVTIAAFEIREPFFTDISTSVDAQIYLTIAVALASLAVGVAFTYHGYFFLNEDERLEQQKALPVPASSFSLAKKTRPLDDALTAEHYRELLLGDIFAPYPDEPETDSSGESKAAENSKSFEGIDLDKLKRIQEEMRKK